MMALLGSASAVRIKMGQKQLSTASSMSAVQTEANSSKFCNPWGSRTVKKYFFEFKFAEREYPTAMSLIRDPYDPQLNVYDNRSWVIFQRDKTTGVINCRPYVNTSHTKVHRMVGQTHVYEWGQPDKCSGDLHGQKGFIYQGSLSTKCSGWSWFGQCPEILQVNLTNGQTVYLPNVNVRRTANSKPEGDFDNAWNPTGDGWIAQDKQSPKQPLYWQAECAQNASECSSAPQVIKLRNLTSITRRQIDVKNPETGDVERLTGIRLKHADGTEQEILGGMYYPYEAVRKLTWDSRWSGANKSSGCFNCTQSPGNNREKISTFSLIWELTKGTYVGSMYALIAASAFMNPISLLVLPGFTNTFGNAWWQARKHVKELKLSPSEKIWSKLECHAMFQRCSADMLVPKGKPCDGI